MLAETTLMIGEIELERAGIKNDVLKGETAVITGASSNIGLGYARTLAAAGANVVIADVNAEGGIEAERLINLENGRDCALYVRTDVTMASQIQNLKDKAIAKFGKVDILLNNAMDMRLTGKILESSIDDLDMSYKISGRGVALALQAFVPDMLKRKHGVVTYSSTQFHYAPPLIGGSVYCAGKTAATSVIMSVANEIGPYSESGVSIFCLLPANVFRYDPSKKLSPYSDSFKVQERAANSVTPEQNAAAMVYCILNREKLHRSGVINFDVFKAMGSPFELPGGGRSSDKDGAPPPRRLNDMELTLVFSNMGEGL